MKDGFSGYELYQKKYGHLDALAFPIEEEVPWHSGLGKLEYVASQLLAAWCGSFASSADRVIVDGPTVVREAIVDVVDVAELFLEEIESRRRERREACDREVAEEKARREAIGAESQKFIANFKWEEWINELRLNIASLSTPWETYLEKTKKAIGKNATDSELNEFWIEECVEAKLRENGFTQLPANPDKKFLTGIIVKWQGFPYCSVYHRKAEVSGLRNEYNLYAAAESSDGLKEWFCGQITEQPIKKTQEILAMFYELGFEIEVLNHGGDDLPF